MSMVFERLTIRAVDSDDDIRRIDTWGHVAQTDFDKLQEIIDAGANFHGLKVVGKIERFVDRMVDKKAFKIPTGQEMVYGELIFDRDGHGSVFLKGKLPVDPVVVDSICKGMITGTKSIGGSPINGVTPNIRIKGKYQK